MPPFAHFAVPIIVVWDADAQPPSTAPSSVFPIISRSVKNRLGTDKVTVLAGSPTNPESLHAGLVFLALQYGELQKIEPGAADLVAAEFIADNFNVDAVMKHLQHLKETGGVPK